MPIVTVSKHGQTKSGKPVVYFNNKHDYTDMFFLNDGVQAPPIGATIDALTVSSKDGRFWSLKAWGVVPGSQVPPPQPQQAPQQYTTHAPTQAPDPSPDAPVGLPMEPGDALRFISNMVGSAVASGTCKLPADMAPWAVHALKIIRRLRDGTLASPDIPDTYQPPAKAAMPPAPSLPPRLAGGMEPAHGDEFGDMNDPIPF
ncbi:hypothetical protein UFOVP154_11 [uncultured Caudovirales phage]|uniref:Uncharacterized protein n=1 Tax=uncultured Caudovirales phage TaxID=2100421 RepID=A0A6J7WCK4_9CAUD|nr:hypothetical protein UFOVP8_60 [uncultured Caudovirales phage]CAB5170226.1 hypothetical protein UFOVP154_11 [uncultured Caudovirales phage]